MKKIPRTFFLAVAFTTATFFISCSDSIYETENQQTDNELTTDIESVDSGRCCFTNHSNGDHIGHSCGYRGGRSGRSGRGRR